MDITIPNNLTKPLIPEWEITSIKDKIAEITRSLEKLNITWNHVSRCVHIIDDLRHKYNKPGYHFHLFSEYFTYSPVIFIQKDLYNSNSEQSGIIIIIFPSDYNEIKFCIHPINYLKYKEIDYIITPINPWTTNYISELNEILTKSI